MAERIIEFWHFILKGEKPCINSTLGLVKINCFSCVMVMNLALHQKYIFKTHRKYSSFVLEHHLEYSFNPRMSRKEGGEGSVGPPIGFSDLKFEVLKQLK